MNTQSHAILTFFLLRRGLGRRLAGLKGVNGAIFAGALVTDLPIYALFLWYTLVEPTPQRVIWREIYFRPEWQSLTSASHSFPLWGAALAAALLARRPRAALFCAAALLAAAQDFLLHHDDAHAHFFPFSDYRFASPVSYWDPAHYGAIASLAELALVIAAAVWAWPRLASWWGKGLLVLAVASLLFTGGMWSFLFENF